MTRTLIALFLLLPVAACGDGDDDGDNGAAASPAASATERRTPGATVAPEESATPTAVSDVPGRDLVDLARRFRGFTGSVPARVRDGPFGHGVGDREEFRLLDLEEPALVTVSATVRHVTEHGYFFVEDGLPYSASALQRIGKDFETIVYPGVRADFGAEPNPGIDSDPRITILHADLRGAGGYFSQSDQYPRSIAERSNEREMLYLHYTSLSEPGPAYNALLGHELQHMIHWYADEDEDSWVNEGLSEVATHSAGAGPSVSDFLANPDTQLNYWPLLGGTGIHYSATELFFTYLLDHYGGRESAKDLLAIASDGIEGVDAYLRTSGGNTTFRRVFADWVVANYLGLEEGPYSHPSFDGRGQAVTPLRSRRGGGSVKQFAADYLEVSGQGTFVFDGADSVGLGVPDPPQAGFWWSNRGDGIDTRLTREFDLGDVSTATLRFDAWFETERGWDYAYVAASRDGGRTWRALRGRRTTDENPVELAYGPGYTGSSGGWVEEEVDLSEFAGEASVQIRFEYVTDDAASTTGFAVNNIEIPETGFRDAADSAGGWVAEGFVRTTGVLEQEFVVQAVDMSGQTPDVSSITLDGYNKGEIAVGGRTIIVVSGVTEMTAEAASYSWELR